MIGIGSAQRQARRMRFGGHRPSCSKRRPGALHTTAASARALAHAVASALFAAHDEHCPSSSGGGGPAGVTTRPDRPRSLDGKLACFCACSVSCPRRGGGQGCYVIMQGKPDPTPKPPRDRHLILPGTVREEPMRR